MLEFLHHLFLPHTSNNFKAKILHFDFFLFYIALFFIGAFSLKIFHNVSPDILGYATDIRIEKLLDLTNQKRAGDGIGVLRYNDQLSRAAAAKAADMFAKNYWAHNAPDGTTPWSFIHQVGYTYSVAGENLAKNFSNSDGVVEAWMNSPSHRENLLRSQYSEVGFAVVNGMLQGEETTLVVQMFGKPLSTIAKTEEVEQSPQFVASVKAASENTVPAGSLAEALPSPESSPLEVPAIAQEVEVPDIAGFVSRQPLFDIPSLSKNLSLIISVILMLTLLADGLYIWRHNIVRISSRTGAHILFVFMLSGFIWFMSAGSIL